MPRREISKAPTGHNENYKPVASLLVMRSIKRRNSTFEILLRGMGLKIKIQEDITSALKEGRTTELSTLRMVIAAIGNKETEKRTKIWREKPELEIKTLEKESRLVDEEVLEVLSSEAKKRKEACVEYERGGRTDLLEREKQELEIIQRYLPEQLSEEGVAKIAREVIKAAGASDAKDTGRIMAQLMPRVKGRADGGLVSRVVRELLNQ